MSEDRTQTMDFADAVRIVEMSLTTEGRIKMTSEDFLRVGEAQAILAAEYVKVKERIMPA